MRFDGLRRHLVLGLGGHLSACLAILVGLLISQQVSAQEFVSEDWQFQVTPYLWALSAEGDLTVRGQQADVDLSFKDVVEELNYGLMLQGDVRKGRIGVYVNLLYANLGDEENVGATEVDPEVNMFWGGLGAYYRLGPFDLDSNPNSDGPQLIVDPYAGVRYTYLDMEIDVKSGPEFDGEQDWIDPIIGLRTIWQFNERWSLTALGDIGGFGVGSDFTWQSAALVGYRLSLFADNDSRFLVGYRALHQDYETGSGANKFEWDVTLHGPTVALGIQF